MIDNTLKLKVVTTKDEWMIWLDDVLVLGSLLVALEKDDDVLRIRQNPLAGDGLPIALAVMIGFITNSITQAGNGSSIADTFAETPLGGKMF